jgi:hypothetical protein
VTWPASLDAPALRRVGLAHLAGGGSPRGSPWNGCGWAAETLHGGVNHALYNYMASMRPISRDLLIGGLVQIAALVFAGMILDEGGWALATCRISAAFWVGVIIVLVRRHNALTRGDHRFLRYGLLPLLVAGIPITLTIWAYRGVV